MPLKILTQMQSSQTPKCNYLRKKHVIWLTPTSGLALSYLHSQLDSWWKGTALYIPDLRHQ